MPIPEYTQSHLLNRLLQRQISELESENAALKARVAKLETRVTDSTSKHRALNGSAADDITRATNEAQMISRETERAAKLMVQQFRQTQNRLVEVSQEIHHEQERLAQAIGEFYSTLDTLQSHAKRDATIVVRTAHARQEILLSQLAELYDGNGDLRFPDTRTRIRARKIEDDAVAIRRQLTKTIERDYAHHEERMNQAHTLGRTLVQLLTNATQNISKLQTQLHNQPPKNDPPASSTGMNSNETGETTTAPPVPPSNGMAQVLLAPDREAQVFETARRALNEEASLPRPSAPASAITPFQRIQYDTDTMRVIPAHDILIAPSKPRTMLLSLAVVSILLVIMTLIASMM